MKGTNEITVNQETACDAFEEYFGRRMPTTNLKCIKVEEKKDSQGWTDGESFRVHLEVTEAETPAGERKD